MNDGREIEGENYMNIVKKKKNRKKRSGSTDSVPGGHAPAPPRPPKPGFDKNPEPEQPAEEDERQYLTSLPTKRPDTSSSSNAGESRPRTSTSQPVALPTKLPDEKAKKKEKKKSNPDGKGTFNGGFELPPGEPQSHPQPQSLPRGALPKTPDEEAGGNCTQGTSAVRVIVVIVGVIVAA